MHAFKPLQFFLQIQHLLSNLTKNEYLTPLTKQILHNCTTLLNVTLIHFSNCQSYFQNNMLVVNIGKLQIS